VVEEEPAVPQTAEEPEKAFASMNNEETANGKVHQDRDTGQLSGTSFSWAQPLAPSRGTIYFMTAIVTSRTWQELSTSGHLQLCPHQSSGTKPANASTLFVLRLLLK
jgi:hypothetical protein